MIVILDLDKQTLAYKNNEPFIQGEDSRNVLQVAVPYSEVDDSFDIQIAYQLQNGRSTIKMANSGVDEETLTIDGVVHALINFNIPRIATSLSGNLLMTLIVKTSDNKLYKFNALNVVLSRVEFEEWEEAFADSTLLEELEAMESSITALQSAVANRVINGVNPTAINISSTAVGSANMRLYKLSGDATFASYSERINLEGTNYATIKGYRTLDLIGLYKVVLGGDYYSFEVHSMNDRKGFEFWDEQDDRALLVKIDESGVKSNVPYYYNNDLVATQSFVNSRVYGNSVSLSGASGTLTSAEATILVGGSYKNPVIKYYDGSNYLTLNLFYKSDNSCKYAYFEIPNITGAPFILVRNLITITKFGDVYNWTRDRNQIMIYPSSEIDTKVSNLQSQIDGINAGQNLADIVADLSALQSLDTSKLQANDKVQVLVDSNHDNASTVYNWSGTAWGYIGKYGQDGYTKSEEDTLLATKQNVIDNNNKLSSDYVDDTNSVDHKFVSQDEINFFTMKQDPLVETDSTAVSGGGVVVKDTYIESTFFATDSEVANMLEEVFA